MWIVIICYFLVFRKMFRMQLSGFSAVACFLSCSFFNVYRLIYNNFDGLPFFFFLHLVIGNYILTCSSKTPDYKAK